MSGESPAPDAAPAPGAGGPTRRPRRPLGPVRRAIVLVGVVALLMLAAAGGGVAGGWTIANGTLVAAQADPRATVLKVPAYVGVGTVSMPDLRGLSVDDAMQVLADAGVPANIVRTSTRPSAGDKGTVVAQTPTYGAESPAKVSLVVSAGGTMPDVVGRTVDAATSTLNDLGVRIERAGGYDPDAAVGTVLTSAPKAGADLPQAVHLVVNEPPSSRYLSTLQTTEGGCSTDSALAMDGTTYQQGLDCSAGTADSPNDTTWLLEKHVDVVSGRIGVPDTQQPGTTARVRLIGDGDVLLDRTVRYGATIAVRVRTSGVLRFTVRVTAAADAEATVGLGDLQLSGSSAAIAALPTQ